METFFTIFVSCVFKSLAFKMSKLKEIIHQVSLLFLEFGIKSMSMDDLASSLRISKKTLYKYVSDKNDLVYQVMKEIITLKQEQLLILCEDKTHPIDELIAMIEFSGQEVSMIHPSIQYDLKKYYPESWKLFEIHKHGFIYERMLENIEKGMEMGVYRDNLNASIVAKIYASRADLVFNAVIFPPDQYDFKTVLDEMMRHHIRGIATEKGIKYLKTKILNDNKHSLL